uniref:SH2 domain-containing protein n=1 Tax=Schistocephalus solidus TaxID=70667 RepID=A0A183SQ73_SCHSO
LGPSVGLKLEPHLGDDEAVIRPTIGIGDRLGYQHVLLISPPDEDIVQQLPVPRSRVHPRGLLPRRKAENKLQAALTESYRQISSVKADLSRASHENHVLRISFDQLQQKFVLLHEEYTRELQRLGSSSKLHGIPPARPYSPSISAVASMQETTPVDQGLELTEDMDAVDCLLDAPLDPHASASARGRQAAKPLIELAPVVPTDTDLMPEILSLRLLVLFSDEEATSHSEAQPIARTLTIGQQELPNPHGKFRLPNYDCLSPVEGEPPVTLERYCVTVKPKNINFRSRFALPLSTSRRSAPLDLFTEIQTADSSFPVAGISPASEATSYQVSEIAADCIDSSPGQATITTSTSTIKPKHSTSIDDFDTPMPSAPPSTLNFHYFPCSRLPTAKMTESNLSWARRSASDLEVRDYYTLTSPSEGEMDSSSSESCNVGASAKPKLVPSSQPDRCERCANPTVTTSPDSCGP